MAFRCLRHHARSIKQIQDFLHTPNNTTSVVGAPARLPHSSIPLCSSHLINLEAQQNSSTGRRPIHTSACYHAGHSKWSNIKHIKGAQDKARQEKSSALARKLQLILNRNPGANPKLNPEIISLMKWARTNNVPNDVIDRTLERAVKLRDPANLSVFVGRGLSNTAIVLECMTLKPIHTRGVLQGMVRKYGFNLNTSADDLFDNKGIVETDVPEEELSVAQNDPDNFPLDKYVDIAIEAGAEDVVLQYDSEAEKPYLEFTCAPQDLNKTQTNVENAGLVVTSSERTYIPTQMVPASPEYLNSLEVLKSKMDIHPDIVKYHFNIVPEES